MKRNNSSHIKTLFRFELPKPRKYSKELFSADTIVHKSIELFLQTIQTLLE